MMNLSSMDKLISSGSETLYLILKSMLIILNSFPGEESGVVIGLNSKISILLKVSEFELKANKSVNLSLLTLERRDSD